MFFPGKPAFNVYGSTSVLDHEFLKVRRFLYWGTFKASYLVMKLPNHKIQQSSALRTIPYRQ